MNLMAMHELTDENIPKRRQVDRLIHMFKEQIDELAKSGEKPDEIH